MDILEKIVRAKKKRLARTKADLPVESLIEVIGALPGTKGFKRSLVAGAPGEARIIAEIKLKSPSAGELMRGRDVLATARAYEKGGAACISVVTEEDNFGGMAELLHDVRAAVSLPLLRKDFIIDEYQIVEARAYGADAVLLIASILDAAKLKRFIQSARGLGLDSLVEVHDGSELRKALAAGAQIVGINNRDLKTFKVDLRVSARLVAEVPDGVVCVSESGIRTREDVAMLAKAGVDAFLIGETLLRAKNPGVKVGELSGRRHL
jgi:indole-3-glycerol phosphate synthase